MELSPLYCPVCGSVIPGEEVHLELSLARCTACRAVFDLAGRSSQIVQALPAARPTPMRARVPLPPKFQVDESASGLKVSWRWFGPASVFLAFFCLFWDGFLVVWYSIALFAEETPVVMVLFPLIHVAVGVGLTWYTVATFVNRTELEITRGRLQVRHGPLPWGKPVDVDGRALKQLYGVEKISRGKNGVSVTYTLNAIDRAGVRQTLLKGLEGLDQVLWLEQALERQLAIEDTPVEGEVARRSA